MALRTAVFFLAVATRATALPSSRTFGVDCHSAPTTPCCVTSATLKQNLDTATQVLNAANKQFNTTLKSEEGRVGAAAAAQTKAFNDYEAAMNDRNSKLAQQNQAEAAMSDKLNEVGRLVSLCSTPQPPSDCGHQLRDAQAAVRAANLTLVNANKAYKEAQTLVEVDDGNRAQAISNYDTAVTHQENAVQRAHLELAKFETAVNTASADWNDCATKCSEGQQCTPPGRASMLATLQAMPSIATPSMMRLGAEVSASTKTFYKIDGAECGQSTVASKYAVYAKQFGGLTEGTCASVGYTKKTGSQTVAVPVIGSVTVETYTKP